MTRIAFAACAQFQRDAEQPVWNEIADHQPDHLMLLGDQIYMDYGGDHKIEANGLDIPTGFVGYNNGAPRTLDLGTFEFQMRLRYRQQFSTPSFRKLVRAIGRRGGTVAMIWDDHDFGFNNALGAPGGPSDANPEYRDHLISPEMKAVSRRLFEEFKSNVYALRGSEAAPYAELKDWRPAKGKEGVEAHYRWGAFEVFMLDTRSFRQSPAICECATGATILGDQQWSWLQDGLRADGARMAIIASGSPFSSPGAFADQSWKQADGGKLQPYREYHGLLALATELHPRKRMLFIGGDRHAIEVIEDHPALPELICAGSAAPKPLGIARHFCLVDLDEQAQGGARLFTRGEDKLRWSTNPAGSVQRRTARKSTLFLMTNRKVVNGTAGTEVTDSLRYYRFDADGLQEPASRLSRWCELPNAAAFWAIVETYTREQVMRNPLHANQICLFVPGNGKTNEEVIDKLRVLTAIAFDPQGSNSMGCAIAFDWATARSSKPSFKLAKQNYKENIERAKCVAPLFAKTLTEARRSADAAQVWLSICSHSVGNRVALRALTCLPDKRSIDRWFVNAADLDYRVFDSPNGKAALSRCRSVLVPFTLLDQELCVAESRTEDNSPRLGRHGPSGERWKASPNLYPRDVTSLASKYDAHTCLFWHVWPETENSGPLQSAFANAMALGAWV